MNQIILAYHMLDEERRESLQQGMAAINVEVRFLEEKEYELTLAELLDVQSEAAEAVAPAGKKIEDEMLVFAGIASDQLQNVLQVLRELNIRVTRKAMLTKSNQAWNGLQLFDELTQEVAYVEQMRKK